MSQNNNQTTLKQRARQWAVDQISGAARNTIKNALQEEGPTGRTEEALKFIRDVGDETLKDPELREAIRAKATEEAGRLIGDTVETIKTELQKNTTENLTRLQQATLDLAPQEAQTTLSTYERIRESLTTPEDGFFGRLFKTAAARVLAWGAGVVALIGARWLANWTGRTEDEEEIAANQNLLGSILRNLIFAITTNQPGRDQRQAQQRPSPQAQPGILAA